MIFHNGSNYDYHFIVKELAKEFEGEVNCLGESEKKSNTFSVPITKEIRGIGKRWIKLNRKSYLTILNFIDSARFMVDSELLSNLFNNLAEGIYKHKFKYGHDNRKSELTELNTEIPSDILNTKMLEMIC